MKFQKTRSKIIGFSFLSLFLLALFFQAPLMHADEEVKIDYEARSGMVVLGKLNGEIELRVSCSETVKTTKIYFNDEQVYSTEKGDFKWVFDTKDYDSGSVEIKVIAETETGDTFESTKNVEFMTEQEAQETLITIIGVIIGVVVVLVAIIVAAVLYYRKK